MNPKEKSLKIVQCLKQRSFIPIENICLAKVIYRVSKICLFVQETIQSIRVQQNYEEAGDV